MWKGDLSLVQAKESVKIYQDMLSFTALMGLVLKCIEAQAFNDIKNDSLHCLENFD